MPIYRVRAHNYKSVIFHPISKMFPDTPEHEIHPQNTHNSGLLLDQFSDIAPRQRLWVWDPLKFFPTIVLTLSSGASS